MPHRPIDLSRVRTFPLPQRKNRVSTDNFIFPDTPINALDNAELREIIRGLVTAHLEGCQIIWMIGGHVVKRGLSPLLIDLMKRGIITHLASNGAASIHDFEIAYRGFTSEDVASSIEDGSFGMAEETGSFMNQAIRQGAWQGIGMGESLGKWIDENPNFQHRELSLLYQTYRLGIPYTIHVAIGTDIIHQHPLVDFGATGWTSGQDFKIFTNSVSKLEGGVFCNYGSAVIGPEVFLKALSISRNLGFKVSKFITANFDMIPLENYREPIGEENIDYYYRPRKNIVNRPVSMGGQGFHVSGDHLVTIPSVHHGVLAELSENQLPTKQISSLTRKRSSQEIFRENYPRAFNAYSRIVQDTPSLESCLEGLFQATTVCLQSFLTNGTLYISGNGGSMADAIHISAELNKSFVLSRPIPSPHRRKMENIHETQHFAHELQQGLRTIVLGVNPALTSAINNDFSHPHMEIAQELYAMARGGDVFLGISTSGNAKNIINALNLAGSLGLVTIALTGQDGGTIARLADIVIRAQTNNTAEIQQWHSQFYHAFCEMLEAAAFDD